MKKPTLSIATPIRAATLALIAAMALLTCEKIPDYCGRGEQLDPKKQFCFENRTYDKCGKGDYNPNTQTCDGNLVRNICSDGTIVPPGTPCGGYTLTATVAPANGGSATRDPDEPSYHADAPVAVTATPANGYAFYGWVGASTSTLPGDVITMDNNKAVIAIFNPAGKPGATTFTLTTTTVPENGGSINRSPSGPDYAAGTTVEVTATAANGYTFTGWAGAAMSTNATITVTMDANKPLVAMFTPTVTYSLTTNANPPAGGTAARTPNNSPAQAAGTYTPGTQVTVTATQNAGYVFTGWSGASNSTSNPVTINMDDGKTLTANFRLLDSGENPPPPPTIYTLTANANPAAGGSVTRTPNYSTGQPIGAYVAGTQVTATAIAAEGYTFTGWSGASTSISANVVIVMNGDRELTANFEPIPHDNYTLSVNANPPAGGSVTRDPEAASYAEGAQVTVRAMAAEGYTFTGWSGASISTSDSVVIIMDDNKTLTAHFQVNTTDPCILNPGSEACCAQTPSYPGCGGGTYTLSTNASPETGGSITLDPNKTSYSLGETVTVTAKPAAGYDFTGWTGASTSANTVVTITMDNNKTLTAYFQQQTTIDYGTLTDPRDSKNYKTVKIGNQTWMAENLNYNANGSVCYDSSSANCVTYGRLYDWNTAMTACPEGWHLPSDAEWHALVSHVNPTCRPNDSSCDEAGKKLKSGSGWDDYQGVSGNGTNDVGFSALPGGYGFGGSFEYAGSYGNWWSATEYSTGGAWYRYIFYFDYVSRFADDEAKQFAVRCAQDDGTTPPPTTYTLSVNANPTGGGTVTRNPDKTNYNSGEYVTVTAAAAEGYTFIGWAGAATSTNTAVVVTMDGNKALTANFTHGVDGGLLKDERDGQEYRTVIIDGKRWMAENLNYNASGSVCYDSSESYCNIYGRLYDWATVMKLPSSCNSDICAGQVQGKHQGICPSGWYIPSNDEWEALVQYVDPNARDDYENVAGTKLKSETGWNSRSDYIAGTDAVGFSALPGGYGYGGSFYYAGNYGNWWSATEYDDAGGAWNRDMAYNLECVGRNANFKSVLFAARCAQD